MHRLTVRHCLKYWSPEECFVRQWGKWDQSAGYYRKSAGGYRRRIFYPSGYTISFFFYEGYPDTKRIPGHLLSLWTVWKQRNDTAWNRWSASYQSFLCLQNRKKRIKKIKNSLQLIFCQKYSKIRNRLRCLQSEGGFLFIWQIQLNDQALYICTNYWNNCWFFCSVLFWSEQVFHPLRSLQPHGL